VEGEQELTKVKIWIGKRDGEKRMKPLLTKKNKANLVIKGEKTLLTAERELRGRRTAGTVQRGLWCSKCSQARGRKKRIGQTDDTSGAESSATSGFFRGLRAAEKKKAGKKDSLFGLTAGEKSGKKRSKEQKI